MLGEPLGAKASSGSRPGARRAKAASPGFFAFSSKSEPTQDQPQSRSCANFAHSATSNEGSEVHVGGRGR
eukprot:11200816-Alexandrium_andersonii.AAC.1